MDYGHALFLHTAIIKIADAVTVFGMWHLCWYLRFDRALLPITKGLPSYGKYSQTALPLVLVFTVVFHAVGAYRRDRLHFGFRSLKKVVQATLMASLVFVSLLYFKMELNYSRYYLVLFAVLTIPALILERTVLHGLWLAFERNFVQKLRVLLLGSGNLLELYWEKIMLRRPYPIECVGRIGDANATGILSDVTYLGPEENLEETLRTKPIDMVVVSYPTEAAAGYAKILERLSNELVTVKVLPDFGKYSTFTYRAEDECGVPLLAFNHATTGATDRVLKRALDILGSAAFLLVFSPLYLVLGLLVKLTSRGPVFYSQLRMGADGKIFSVYKFRSMRVDAEAKTGAVWATKDDDRTTAFGKWIRRTSLDEIPQFYNVLKGDMSLVGPRPERPVFVEQFRKDVPKYMLRHKMKSGITGWAQVNGWRGNTSIEERIKFDLFYIGHWSHLFDLKIILMTPMTLVKGFVQRHAY